MSLPSAFSAHRFDREFKEWNPLHREFARYFAKSLYRHSKEKAEIQFEQSSMSVEQWQTEFEGDFAFFLCPLRGAHGAPVVAVLPSSFCSLLVALLEGGRLSKNNLVSREISRLDEVALRPVVEDFFACLDEAFGGKLSPQIARLARESTVSELSLKLGREKLKKFFFFGSFDEQIDISFSLLYPYPTLSAIDRASM